MIQWLFKLLQAGNNLIQERIYGVFGSATPSSSVFRDLYLLFIVFFTDLGLLLTRLEPGSDPNQNSEFNWTVEHQDLISDLQLDCCTTAGFAHARGGSNTKGRSSRRKPSLARSTMTVIRHGDAFNGGVQQCWRHGRATWRRCDNHPWTSAPWGGSCPCWEKSRAIAGAESCG